MRCFNSGFCANSMTITLGGFAELEKIERLANYIPHHVEILWIRSPAAEFPERLQGLLVAELPLRLPVPAVPPGSADQ